MSDFIRVTSPDGGVSIVGSGTRRFFERKNNFFQGRKDRFGKSLPLYKIEDYDGPAEIENAQLKKKK